MGLIHNELRRTALSPALKNALGASRGDGGLERYGETLTPIIDLWARPEWAFLRGELIGIDRAFQAAVALEGSIIALVNPSTSRKIVVVDAITATVGTAGATAMAGLATEAQIVATLTLGSVMSAADRRVTNAGFALQTQRWGGSDPAAPFVSSLESVTDPNVSGVLVFRTSVPCILPPGQAFYVQNQTVNSSMTMSSRTRERAALPGEL